MNLEYFISKRLIFAKENKNVFSRPIIRITIAAISLSICVMIMSLSILLGFKKTITEKVVSCASHIQITSLDKYGESGSTLMISDSLIDSLKKEKRINDVEGVVYEFGLIKKDGDFIGVNLKGVFSDYNWDVFSDNIIEGTVLNSDSSILISSIVANKLNISVGDKVPVYFFNVDHERIRVRPFYVQGIYKTSIQDFDLELAVVDISQLQKINGFQNNEVQRLEINVSDFSFVDEVSNNIHFLLEDPYNKNVRTVKSLYPQIFDWLNLQDVNVKVILILMLLVAAVNVVSTLFILVLERTRLIGILKSLGSSSWSIRKIFLYHVMYLSLRGLFWGNLLSFSILFIQKKFNIIRLDEATYYMETVPLHFDFFYIGLLNIGMLLLCLFMMIGPTIIINKIIPIKSIKFE